MDSKQTALATIAVLGGIGILAVSCSDSDDGAEKPPAVVDSRQAVTPVAPTTRPVPVVVQHEQKTAQGVGRDVHWAYDGEGAPSLWGGLKQEYALCRMGKQQSPIDISTVTITDLADIEFNYQPSPLDITNNGHTIQVNYAAGSSMTVDGKQYELLQFHFHSPSEHTVGGKAYDMVVHLVHKAADGQLGVIGVMFKTGGEVNNAIAKLWLNMPETAGETVKVDDVMISAADLLPRDLTYFNYSGSLTTPPCSEGVNWMVMATPGHIAPVQVKQFTDLFPLNVRPVQPLNGRSVKVSN